MMNLVALSVTVVDALGVPVRDAAVTAVLTMADRDSAAGVWVLPSVVSGVSDPNGVVVLNLWPNALGTQGSQYRITATSPSGVELLAMTVTVPAADCDLIDLGLGGGGIDVDGFTTLAGAAAVWPVPNPARAATLVQDVVDLLQDSVPSAETVRKVTRWIDLVLQHMGGVRRWGFLECAANLSLAAAVGQVDLQGDIAQVVGLHGPVGDLVAVPLGTLLTLRTAGDPTAFDQTVQPLFYALEGARRLHLWPEPAAEYPVTLRYQRSLTIDLVPDDLEQVVVSGVLGRYGRHFDRDALSQDPAEFETRYRADIANAGRLSWDAVQVSAPIEVRRRAPGATVGAVLGAVVQLPEAG